MKIPTLLLVFTVVPVLTYAQTQNIYVHKAGIDTSIYSQPQTKPDFGQLDGLSNRISAKRAVKKKEKRDADYSVDLLDLTGGLKNINTETIKPLIKKYPERSDELIEMLRNSN